MKIDENTKIKEIISGNSTVAAVFKKHNLDCLACRGLEQDTVKQVAINNGLDVNDFLKELNEASKSG
ncbi:MAG: DUF1858 domain-containing protein [Spirochaetota bacterium]